MCVGFKPGAEEWRAQKDPLSYVVCSQRPFTLSREHWSGNTLRKVNNARAIPMRSIVVALTNFFLTERVK